MNQSLLHAVERVSNNYTQLFNGNQFWISCRAFA